MFTFYVYFISQICPIPHIILHLSTINSQSRFTMAGPAYRISGTARVRTFVSLFGHSIDFSHSVDQQMNSSVAKAMMVTRFGWLGDAATAAIQFGWASITVYVPIGHSRKCLIVIRTGSRRNNKRGHPRSSGKWWLGYIAKTGGWVSSRTFKAKCTVHEWRPERASLRCSMGDSELGRRGC